MGWLLEKDVFMFWIRYGSGAVITSGMSFVCCILAPPAEELHFSEEDGFSIPNQVFDLSLRF